MNNKLLIFIIFIFTLLLHLTLARKAQAIDLGVWGESSPIAEEDFETHIVKQLETLGEDKLRKHQEQIKDKIVANIKRPRAVKGVSKATTNISRFYDPSFTLQENIYNEKQQLLYPVGTKINPLEKKSFDEIWIFIDGDDELQVNFAKAYQEDQQQIYNGKKTKDQNTKENKAKTENLGSIERTEKNTKIKKIILLNGAPGAQKDGSFFFFDQAGSISSKLDINKVPSVVKQAPDQMQILIEEIALDDLDQLDNATNNLDNKNNIIDRKRIR